MELSILCDVFVSRKQYGLDTIMPILQMRTQAYDSLLKILFIHRLFAELLCYAR